ncbi:TetR/AcrR family transcriptional regulator [Solibacillus sp. A46]|uniref:TetR/AcrR family transcriptional regulator n=1 Tax=Solibacillus faecavium TaxID=2762221 RepID=A0ABR8XV11_9BACL|nr:TetR/AcrR family transcriptional regulator [Solibacillus faecavium]MBD8035738.1 TetR/AcrR family transcriptional regulator [Solibacillus faecavium]
MARGRRVNSSGEKSKKLLLEKAIELFSTYGYHQTKISDIVKAANLTQPTFYLYFQSKETLFNDLNEQFQNELVELFSDASNDVTNENYATDIIQKNLKKMFDYFMKNPNLTKIGFYDAEQSTAVKQMLVSKLENVINNNLNEYSVAKQVNATVLAESLIGSMERLTLTNLLTNKTNPEQLAQDISMIYFSNEKSLVHQ